MNATLSTRQLQLVGLFVVAVVVLGVGYAVVSKHSSTSPTTQTTARTTPAVSTPATTTPTGKAHSHTVTPAKLSTHGLPVPVARALQKHSVVVVDLYVPSSDVDQITGAEAQAGAKAAGAGFVAVDVLNQKSGTAMLRKLGVVDTPLVLVIKRPANILSEFHGLVDRAVVAQAVTEAR